MSHANDPAVAVATAIACNLGAPPAITDDRDRCLAQSLAKGAVGIALLHIERARTGLAGWETAHAWLKTAADGDISAADDAGLFSGAPAVAFALHAAGEGRYTRALAKLDAHVTGLAHRRASQAQARIDSSNLPRLAEFDLIYGLTGIGAYLLRRDPGGDALEHVLRYLVRLAEPLHNDGQILPGWWTSHDPSFKYSPAFAGGHANFGIAHGIAGPLALLSLATRNGVTVDGQDQAIGRICSWLDAWRQDHGTGSWWPQWVTRADLRARRPAQPGPLRPSWCYGTPGLARAQQLAGIATGDTTRQDMAEHALAGCLAHPAQLSQITDTSVCHGWAGLFYTAWRAARDARTPAITSCLPHLADQLIKHGCPGTGDGPGFLEGDTGLALVLHSIACGTPPASGWDACLLLS
ncbi:MAG TPA: lanthionine synthetase C family protein [Streptosporangiaceae bacterium]|nr:lanthionine synthetase C family protein [Streptosporangiaceae bacterium]HVB46232.1 lanthionine synthetase C family protein [Streptosporangiaceae bacterium]